MTRFLFICSAVFTVPPENRLDPCYAFLVTEMPLSGAVRGWDTTAMGLMRAMWCFSPLHACTYINTSKLSKMFPEGSEYQGFPLPHCQWHRSRRQHDVGSALALKPRIKRTNLMKCWSLSQQIGVSFIYFLFFMRQNVQEKSGQVPQSVWQHVLAISAASSTAVQLISDCRPP